MTGQPWLYRVLVDPGATRSDAPCLDLPPGTEPADAARAAATVFAADAAVPALVLRVEDGEVGVTTREHLDRLGRSAVRGLGEGDGATLPGESTRYALLRFACGTCESTAYRVHVGMSGAPGCPNGHGPMEAAP
ncbi:hypothetical protein ABTZ99_29820 [Actinosynnema sp. NPDC002837]|jgi:hypothetical protein